jgi:hypothetical protein
VAAEFEVDLDFKTPARRFDAAIEWQGLLRARSTLKELCEGGIE